MKRVRLFHKWEMPSILNEYNSGANPVEILCIPYEAPVLPPVNPEGRDLFDQRFESSAAHASGRQWPDAILIITHLCHKQVSDFFLLRSVGDFVGEMKFHEVALLMARK